MRCAPKNRAKFISCFAPVSFSDSELAAASRARTAALAMFMFLMLLTVARTPKRETAPEQGVREFNERSVFLVFESLLRL